MQLETEFSGTQMFISIHSFEIVGVHRSGVASSSLHCHYCHTFSFEVKKIMLLSFYSLACFVVIILHAVFISSVFSAVRLILIVCVCPSPPPPVLFGNQCKVVL